MWVRYQQTVWDSVVKVGQERRGTNFTSYFSISKISFTKHLFEVKCAPVMSSKGNGSVCHRQWLWCELFEVNMAVCSLFQAPACHHCFPGGVFPMEAFALPTVCVEFPSLYKLESLVNVFRFLERFHRSITNLNVLRYIAAGCGVRRVTWSSWKEIGIGRI